MSSDCFLFSVSLASFYHYTHCWHVLVYYNLFIVFIVYNLFIVLYIYLYISGFLYFKKAHNLVINNTLDYSWLNNCDRCSCEWSVLNHFLFFKFNHIIYRHNSSFCSLLVFIFLWFNNLSLNFLKSFYDSERIFFTFIILFCFVYIMRNIIQTFFEKIYYNF